MVTRSARHVFAQLVDDVAGGTLVSASTLDESIRGADGDKTAKAKQVGALLAERATKAGITAAVFDRGGHATTGGWPRSRTAHAKAGWPCDGSPAADRPRGDRHPGGAP